MPERSESEPHELTLSERTILDWLLRGDEPQLEALREQVLQGSVRDRTYTGVGFFTHFSVPPSVRRTEPAAFDLSDVAIELAGLEHGAGVVLFVANGALDVLECYTFGGEAWPEDAQITQVHYLKSIERSPGSYQLEPVAVRDPASLLRLLHRY
jgi:hypothetical protein